MPTPRLTTEEKARRKRAHDRARDARRGIPGRAKGSREDWKGIPDEVEANRKYRLWVSPSSITAALMGDPLPGESALDRRR